MHTRCVYCAFPAAVGDDAHSDVTRSFGPCSLALMLRPLMLRRRPEARDARLQRAMAAVSKHEECTAAPILRDARTRLAHLRHRYRTRAPQDEAAQRIANSRLVAEPFAVISNSRCQTAQIFSFPRRVFCARILSLNLHSPRIEGWAERRRAHLVVVVAPVKARVGRVCETRRASCKAYLDALASRRSTVATFATSPLRLRIISGNALNERMSLA